MTASPWLVGEARLLAMALAVTVLEAREVRGSCAPASPLSCATRAASAEANGGGVNGIVGGALSAGTAAVTLKQQCRVRTDVNGNSPKRIRTQKDMKRRGYEPQKDTNRDIFLGHIVAVVTPANSQCSVV